MNSSTLVFVGDHPLLVACAGRASEAGFDVAAVCTDDASIATWAADHEIEVVPWEVLAAHLDRTRPDVLLSVGNLRILPDEMIDAAGCTINFHDGPLPDYAGLHTPMWALLDGVDEYAVSWHVVEGGVDEGDVLASRSFAVASQETTRSMNIKCFGAAGDAFEDVLSQLGTGELQRHAQQGDGRWFGRYDRPVPAGALVPHAMSAARIERLVRALDFGPTINRVGRALLQIDGRRVAVVHTCTVLPDAATAEPGTVLAGEQTADGLTLTVATATAPVKLGCWIDEPVDAVALGGSVLPDPSPILDTLRDAHEASVRNEVWWSRRVAETTAAELAHLTVDHPRLHQADDATVTLGASDFETAAAIVAAYVAVASAQPAATVGVSVAPPDAGLEPWFATVAPVTVVSPGDQSAGEAVAAAKAMIAEARRRGPFLRDVPIRMPVQVDGPLPQLAYGVAIVAPGDEAVAPVAFAIGGGGATVDVRTDASLPASAASRVADGLRAFASALAESPEQQADTLPVVGGAEAALLIELGGSPSSDGFAGALHDQFLAAAGSDPDATAVVHRGTEISYRELEERARRLATALARHGVSPGGFVGVSTAPGLDMVVGILGVLMAGAAYVPLDPRFPADRLSFMVGDAEMDLVLTDDLTSVPDGAPAALDIASTSTAAGIPPLDVLPPVAATDLAYMMYTSGSTGLPKGVMVQHGNVDSFLRAMEPHVGPDDGVWLSVTTLSFDISVLELFYPLTRGWKVVLYEGLAAMRSTPTPAPRSSTSALDMSLFFFGSEGVEGGGSYRVLLDAARFADTHGFGAVWTPERHFNAFGGPFPNPSVTGAAIATITSNVDIRSGSCVLPLHHPVRAAEEWAVVDQLSGGRVGLSIAAGWHPEDFVLRPQNYGQSKAALLEQIDELRRMWRGEAVTYDGPKGPVDVLPLPRPVQAELPIWYTTAGNIESFELAGANGFNLLTHLLGQSLGDLEGKVRAYRAAWDAAGHPGRGTVSLMLHTFVTDDAATVRETVREPMKGYLRDSIALVKEHASAFPTFDPTKTEADGALAGLSPEDLDALLEVSFSRYFETSGLFGDIDQAIAFAEGIAEIDVDEIAALIDFGIEGDTILANLPHLDRVRAAFAESGAAGAEPVEPETYGSLMERHGVTHLQCTPSEARLVLADEQSRRALGGLRKMLVGGEACPLSVAADLHDAVGGELINVYGPTETTIWSTIHRIDTADLEAGVIPIGRPLGNTSVAVTTARGAALPFGAIGELLISGAGVTAGYHDRPELTAERFVRPVGASGVAYRTGDLVSWRSDGALAFHGRADSQVKVRGHRIELGEIETALEQIDDIRQAVVVVQGEADKAALVAHLVAAPGVGGDIDDVVVRKTLATSLPAHMVPERLVRHDVLPTTPNGKVDRLALVAIETAADTAAPAPAKAAVRAGAAHVHRAPTGSAGGRSVAEVAPLIEGAWAAVLGVERVDRSTSFFDHGGNSLQVVALRDRLEEVLGRPVSLVDVFRYGTVNEMATAFAGADEPATDEPDAAPIPSPVPGAGHERASRRAAARQRARRGR